MADDAPLSVFDHLNETAVAAEKAADELLQLFMWLSLGHSVNESDIFTTDNARGTVSVHVEDGETYSL